MSGWRAIGYLAEPAWLWALCALILPIVIHLISRGTARRVSIGSIGLLRARESRRARRVRPTELALLLLRCVLLAVLALALAGWVFAPPSAGESVWGLISAAVAAEADAGLLDTDTSTRLATLRARGQLRRLAPGLPVIRGDTLSGREPMTRVADATPATTPGEGAPEDVWSYLREAETIAPPGTRIEVFAHDRLAHLHGARPTSARSITWASLAPAVPAAAETGATPPQALPPVRIVLRHAADRAEDASYMVAALRAVTEGAPVALDAAEIDTVEAQAALGDVLVWLGDEPMPVAWRDAVSGGAMVLRDQGGRWAACAAHVVGDAFDGSGQPVEPAVRFQRARCPEVSSHAWPVDAETNETPTSPRQTVWRDTHDRPVLMRQRVNEGAVWTLAGRFHPAWSTLVLSPSFPRWLAAWLDEARASGGAVVALRHPAGEQRLPRRADEAADRPMATTMAWPRPVDDQLSPWWWLVVVLVVVERAVALRVGR